MHYETGQFDATRPSRHRRARSGAERRHFGGALRFRSRPLRADLLRSAYRYTRHKHDAEDLVQETYARAWMNYESYEQGTNIRAWMSRIMVNIWMNAHRKSTRRVQETLAGSFTEQDYFAGVLSATPSAEDVALQGQTDDAVKQCFGALPSGFQSVVFYADVCQYPLKDVAEIACIPLGTAMSRRHRAHRRLRAALISSGHQRRAETDAGSRPGPDGGEDVVSP
ncbi:sigma-70 family RNA polymerase sigma factor [Mycolicibacterium mengxianglii]|uniref:sigma-70 family RNA polymerase sigma factor n=1 Tax=Mycolicibacterium mengxianglii TaxID=2736649 RepID=UPI0018EEE15A|nr:sigma-70 family RNA polymerase sigma factor [Mycolicibacterium mengxianglii]